jgi:MYXO-CTERM domain-containing protein
LVLTQSTPEALRAAALLRARDATGSALAQAARPDLARVRARIAAAERGAIAGAATVEVRRNHVYIHDVDGQVRMPFQTFDDLQLAYELALAELYQVLPDEFLFVVLFTSFETGVGAFFYAPLANGDVGIGQPTFDETGPSPLEGLVFMNDWKSFDQIFPPGTPLSIKEGFSRSVFNQEAGHRWAVNTDVGPGVGDGMLEILLGRDRSHWSYFMETGGSPLEGNAWRDNGDGTFTTRTDATRYQYADLDLYLMGLIPAEQVAPWFAIGSPQTNGAFDITGSPINPASPPQIFDPQTIQGVRVDFGIEEVVTRLGPRVPAAGAAPNRWRTAFVMLAGRTSPLTPQQRVEFEAMVDSYAEGFAGGTGNRGALDYRLMGQPMLAPIGAACTLATDCDPAQATLCATPRAGGRTFCSRTCGTAAECPVGWCCGPDGVTSADICQPFDCGPGPMPDAGVADSGVIDPPMDAGVAGADAATGCSGAGCDAGTSTTTPPPVCACDLTFACDPSCPCDPECADARRDPGCSCSSGAPRGPIGPGLAALLAALVLGTRRARRRPRR